MNLEAVAAMANAAAAAGPAAEAVAGTHAAPPLESLSVPGLGPARLFACVAYEEALFVAPAVRYRADGAGAGVGLGVGGGGNGVLVQPVCSGDGNTPLYGRIGTWMFFLLWVPLFLLFLFFNATSDSRFAFFSLLPFIASFN
jgi:hypothetical protein